MRTGLYMFIGLVIGLVLGSLIVVDNPDTVKATINTVQEQSKITDSVTVIDVDLGMQYWSTGYRQGADAAMQSIATGNTGNFSKQMKTDSLLIRDNIGIAIITIYNDGKITLH